MIKKIKVIFFAIGIVMVVFGADIILKNQNTVNINEENNKPQITDEIVLSGNNENTNLENMNSDGKIIEMTSEKFEEEVLNSEKIVLIDFYATWCQPCRMLAPTIEEIAKENQDIKVVKIDVDKETELAMQYGAYSIPTLIVIENGQVKNGTVGVNSKEHILKMIYGE